MKSTRPPAALNWLVPLIAILAIITAGAGLLALGGAGTFTVTTLRGQTVEMVGRGVYQNDSGSSSRSVPTSAWSVRGW